MFKKIETIENLQKAANKGTLYVNSITDGMMKSRLNKKEKLSMINLDWIVNNFNNGYYFEKTIENKEE